MNRRHLLGKLLGGAVATAVVPASLAVDKPRQRLRWSRCGHITEVLQNGAIRWREGFCCEIMDNEEIIDPPESWRLTAFLKNHGTHWTWEVSQQSSCPLCVLSSAIGEGIVQSFCEARDAADSCLRRHPLFDTLARATSDRLSRNKWLHKFTDFYT